MPINKLVPKRYSGRDRRKTDVEKHVQTVIVAVLLALLLWAGNSLLEIKSDVTTLKVQVATLTSEVRSGTDDRFRGTDWRREKQLLDDRFIELRTHVKEIDSRLDRLEGEVKVRHPR